MIDKIINQVCQEYKTNADILKGRSRTAAVALARQVVMYLGWQMTELTLSEIGESLGGRTPATVSHGYQVIADLRQRDRRIHYKLQAIQFAVKIT